MSDPREPRSSRRSDRSAAAPGRRAGDGGRRRVDVVVALAVCLPAAIAILLAAVGDPDNAPAGSTPPVSTGLTSATLSCPGPIAKHAAPLMVARAPGVVGGTVRARTAAAKGRLDGGKSLRVTGPVSLPGGAPTVLDATGAAATGLVAGRREPQAAAACTPPAYDEWYVGLGASASNDSITTLVNPDDGEAVIDIDLLSLDGPISADRVRGLVVPANSARTVDLGRTVPSRSAVAAHLIVSRGRVGVSVEHRYDRLAGAPVVGDYVTPQTTPSTDSLLLGATVTGQSLYLANPGADQAEATIRVQGPDSAFVPTGTKPVEVPPHTLVRVSVSSVVPPSAVKGMLGIVVDSDQPLVADLRGTTDKDLATVGVSPMVTGATAAIVPDGPTRLLLAGATRSGVVNVTVSDAKGHVLAGKKAVELGAQAATSVALPKGAAVVSIDPRNTSVAATLVTQGRDGRAVVPVRDTIVRAEVPAVRPN